MAASRNSLEVIPDISSVDCQEQQQTAAVVTRRLDVFSELIASHGSVEIAPYVHAPAEIFEAFFAFAGFAADETVVEIGSGDGRLLLETARRAVPVTGFEIDPEAIADCRARLARATAEEASRITLRDEDAFSPAEGADVFWAKVDVVYAYLTPRGMKQIWADLVRRLRPGTRVISIQFQPPGQQPTHRQEKFSYVDKTGARCDFTFFEYLM